MIDAADRNFLIPCSCIFCIGITFLEPRLKAGVFGIQQKTPYFAVLLAKYGVFLTIQTTTQPLISRHFPFSFISAKLFIFYFLHFLCIFSKDISTFGKDISRPNPSFFFHSYPKKSRKQRRLARILLHEKRRKRGKYAEK